MPRYDFSWVASQANVRVTIELHAPDDREAGILAAYALQDLSQGHARGWDWKLSVGVAPPHHL